MAQHFTVDVTLPFHVLLYPAPDVPGDWIAHSLEMDVIVQGTSEEHAMQMLHDAVETLVRYNTEHGLIPIQIRFAPPEAWEAARVPRPESIEIRGTWRATPGPSTEPMDPVDLTSLPPFKTIVADRAPAAP